MLSGDGACDLGHIPRVVLWRFGPASFFLRLPEETRRIRGDDLGEADPKDSTDNNGIEPVRQVLGQKGDVEEWGDEAAQKRDHNDAILSSYRLCFGLAGGHLSSADRLRSDTTGRSPGVVCADWIGHFLSECAYDAAGGLGQEPDASSVQ